MAGLPVITGAVHDTSILLAGVAVLVDTLMVGAAGGSFTSFTWMTTTMSWLRVGLFDLVASISTTTS